MSELKCTECGAVLPEDAVECPTCGCPVPEVPAKAVLSPKKAASFPLNIMAIISLILGIAIIIMGANVMKMSTDLDTYTAKHFDVDTAKFGADFYTEIYKASDVIVDELSAVNSGIGLLSESMAAIANVVYYPAGIIIISLGLGVVAISLLHIKKRA